ncbi:UBC-like protein [Linderina pennispora]|uniref:UBC-like protein n=1 Tax=Linderina pennispora TaxID=61395 RepID=A0A1Y1W1V2_9FUNG|nr:UBC-like protein [Linderina pennispora]ORX67255.1 UBC-like protein [Linderina pennispora]
MGPEGTPYAGGKFHVRLTIDSNFPNTPPKGAFQGEICVSTLKKDWQKSYGIEHVLVTVKCLLIYPNPESALNEEAGKLLLEHYDDYAKHAKLMTEDPRTEATPAEPATKRAKKTLTAKERSKRNLRRF